MEISSMDGAFAQTLNDSMSDPAPITTTNNNNEIENHLVSFSENENNFIPSIPNKPEVKIKKLEEAKVITDSNENSLSVDTLIEILSSNGTTSNNLPEKMTSSSTPQTSKRASTAKATATVVKSVSESKIKAPSSSAKKHPSSTNNLSVKSSVKAVNSKLASPFGGKPTITDLNRKMKQAAKRQPRTVYQSQISDNSVGIKICIKKSINSQKKVPSGSSSSNSSKTSPSASSSSKLKRRSRKSKLKERAGSDSEDGYVKRRKKATSNLPNEQKQQESSALEDGPVQEQSRWATHMPKEILFEVSIMHWPKNDVNVFYENVDIILDFQESGEE